MIVIADATPLRYLILIEAIDILSALYGRVLIAQMVADELQRPRTPPPVRQWMATAPVWLEIRVPHR
jgi:predicted nucleic acid-binding protein